MLHLRGRGRQRRSVTSCQGDRQNGARERRQRHGQQRRGGHRRVTQQTNSRQVTSATQSYQHRVDEFGVQKAQPESATEQVVASRQQEVEEKLVVTVGWTRGWSNDATRQGGWSGTEQERESGAQSSAHHHRDPRGVRLLLDAVARAVAHHRILPGLLPRHRPTVRHLLLVVLSQQPHQPVLLRARQPAVQKDVRAYTSTRLASHLGCVLNRSQTRDNSRTVLDLDDT